MKPIIQFSIYLLFLLLNCNSVTASEQTTDIVVEYMWQGKQVSYLSRQQGNQFIFNEGASKSINVATLDWPPYIDRSLCNLGWVLQLGVAVLTSKGYQVNVHFYPWVRAVKMVESGNFEVLYPEYFIEDSAPSDIFPNKKRRELLAQSNQLIGGDIAFMKRKGDPFEFTGNLAAIKGKAIGVVRGYQNTPEFDAMMDAGLISVIEAIDDLQLLKLLMAKRVDLIVGDPAVFNHVIHYSDLDVRNRIAMLDGISEVAPALKYNHLYFAVSTSFEQWGEILNDINLALIELELSGETQRIYHNGSGCSVNFD